MSVRKKPNYNPEKILKDLMDAVTEIYISNPLEGGSSSFGERTGSSLRTVANELDLNPIKVRKLLITAGVYQSEMADQVMELHNQKKTVPEIMAVLQLSKASVNSYLPYSKIPYKAKESSLNAERVKKYRERKSAVEKLAAEGGMVNLWAAITAFEGYPFLTSKGLKYKYTVKGGEIFVDRKEKSITRSTVEIAYKRAEEGGISGPKKLGVFGASYIYPIFMRFGIIRLAVEHENGAAHDLEG